jgi:hypothetical protein
MSFLSDAFKFERYRLGDLWKGIKEDPQRLLTGAFDPLGTSIYNGITGDNLKPLGNQLGAPTEDQYAAAEAKGINTGPGRTMNDAAQVIAAIYGGQALAGAAGLGSSGGGAGAGAGAGAGSASSGYGTAARTGAALLRATNQPNQAPTYGAAPRTQTQGPFRDTFKESQDEKRRKRLATLLMGRAR